MDMYFKVIVFPLILVSQDVKVCRQATMLAAICREEKTVIYVKVKESVYKLAQTQGLQVVKVPRSSRQLAHESGKVVSLMHQPPLPKGATPATHFC